MNTAIVMSATNITKTFITKKLFAHTETCTAVNNITFSLHKGEILGLLGVNGSGKTTTIQMLLDIMTPTSGSISFFGKNIHEHHTDIMQQVTYASGYAKLIGNLTVAQNLYLYGALYGMSKAAIKERLIYLLRQFGIEDLQNRCGRELSAGQTTRALLVRAFLPKPKIILLDEPTASLDPEITREVRMFILKQQQEEQISIIFTSHNMDEVTEICDRVLILHKGSIIADGSPEQLAARVGSAHICLMLEHAQHVALAQTISEEQGYACEVTANQTIKITVSEHKIAELLQVLAQRNVKFITISIEKPTLEDYFLQTSKSMLAK